MSNTPQESASDSEYIALATIGRPVGLDGWCRIFPFGETLTKLSLPIEVQIGPNTPQKSVSLNKLKCENKIHKALFQGYSSRESVDTLKNLNLFLKESELPKRESGEFYHFELEAMQVVAEQSGKIIGPVIRVHNYPTTDALEVKTEDGKAVVIPFNKDVVRSVNSSKGIIIVDDTILEELL